MTTLSIIVLSYNTAALTLRCLQSILTRYSSELAKGEFELIAVDNASGDDSVEQIKSVVQRTIDLWPKKLKVKSESVKFKVIENKENLGFTKGNNIGAMNASGEFLLFLNSDTQVQDNGISKMVDFLSQHTELGILGGRMVNRNGSSQPSYGTFYNLLGVILGLSGLERKLGGRRIDKPKKVDWVSGGSLMVRNDLFKKIGGFDENIFMYLEDMELCFRAKKAGFSTYYFPDIALLHEEHGSSNKTFAIVNIYKGIQYFFRKHKSYPEYIAVKSLLLFKAGIAIIVGMATNNTYLKNTYRQAAATL